MRSFLVLALVASLGLSGCGGGGDEGTTVSNIKQIKTESMTKDGSTWTVAFTSEIGAPVDKVYAAFAEPEKGHDLLPDNVLKSELKSAEGNKKVIDLVIKLDILPPGFKVQNPLNEYEFFPDQKLIKQKTLEFKLADIVSEFRLKPSKDGAGTLVEFKQTSVSKTSLVTDSLQRGALRDTYVIQIKTVEKALGLDGGAKAG
jgi:hypothetical protein